MIGSEDRILVVCAHSDDEAFGCSGSLIKWSKISSQIAIIFLTDGVFSRLNNKKDAKAIRYKEQLQCMKILGVQNFNNYDFPDNGLDGTPLLDLAQVIENEILNFHPTVVLTHSISDLNIDHRRCCEAVLVATRPQPYNRVRLVASFEVLSSTEWFFSYEKIFKPNFYVDITDTLEKKIEACKSYTSEIRRVPHPRSIENVCHLAALRGSTVGLEYAEAYEILRLII